MLIYKKCQAHNNLSGQNGIFPECIEDRFDTQNKILSSIRDFRKNLSGQHDNMTTGQHDNMTKACRKFENDQAKKKIVTRTQFSRNYCASKYAMLLFYIFNNIYILSSKNRKKSDLNQHTPITRTVLSCCHVVMLS